MNYCPKCDKYVEDDNLRFCKDCGTPFIRLKSGITETVKDHNQNVNNVNTVTGNRPEVAHADNNTLSQIKTIDVNVLPSIEPEIVEQEHSSLNQKNIATETQHATNRQDYTNLDEETPPSVSTQITEGGKFGMGVIAGVIVALFIGGALFFLNRNVKKDDIANTTVKQTETTIKTQEAPKVKEPKKTKVLPKTNLDLAKEYLVQRGYDGSYVSATTYSLSNKGFLCYGNKMITVVDIKNDRIAYLLNTDEVIGKYKLFRNKNDNSPLILDFFLGKEPRDKDASAGYWENGNHYLSIYALYDFKPDGSMEHGGLYTGGGRTPSHYHSYLYEMKNVDVADIVLTQLVKLGPEVLNEFPMAKEPNYKEEKTEYKLQNNVNANNGTINARSAFISFHQAITNKQLRTAFNILSPNYQKFMQSYDHFAGGYTTTLRSDVVDLKVLHEDSNSAMFAYTLKAVDREGNGQKIQYFAGKVKLIKLNGTWRIESTEAKRL